MFIHIGDDNVVRSEEIVTIVDYGVITSSPLMEDLVKKRGKKRKVYGPDNQAKSVVVTDKTIYLSSLSVPTLKKRSSVSSMVDNLEDFSDELEES